MCYRFESDGRRNGSGLRYDGIRIPHQYHQNRPFVVEEVELQLTKGDPAEIKAKMDEFNGRRKEKQPLEYPSAGSTFKRPEGYFAGKLIMDAGLRGFRIGGAQVSENIAAS